MEQINKESALLTNSKGKRAKKELLINNNGSIQLNPKTNQWEFVQNTKEMPPKIEKELLRRVTIVNVGSCD